jgi:hypothetical protein
LPERAGDSPPPPLVNQRVGQRWEGDHEGHKALGPRGEHRVHHVLRSGWIEVMRHKELLERCEKIRTREVPWRGR